MPSRRLPDARPRIAPLEARARLPVASSTAAGSWRVRRNPRRASSARPARPGQAPGRREPLAVARASATAGSRADSARRRSTASSTAVGDRPACPALGRRSLARARGGDDRDLVALGDRSRCPGSETSLQTIASTALRSSFSRARSSAPSPCSAAKPTSVWPSRRAAASAGEHVGGRLELEREPLAAGARDLARRAARRAEVGHRRAHHQHVGAARTPRSQAARARPRVVDVDVADAARRAAARRSPRPRRPRRRARRRRRRARSPSAPTSGCRCSARRRSARACRPR